MVTDRLKSLPYSAQSPVNGADNPILTVSCAAAAGEIFQSPPQKIPKTKTAMKNG
jgi:hypothetical protein